MIRAAFFYYCRQGNEDLNNWNLIYNFENGVFSHPFVPTKKTEAMGCQQITNNSYSNHSLFINKKV